jgi:hypothetical protein
MPTAWGARGLGKDANIEGSCDLCRQSVEIRHCTPNATFRHCDNRRERVPENVYEKYCELRDMNGRPRVPQAQGVKWI